MGVDNTSENGARKSFFGGSVLKCQVNRLLEFRIYKA